jgi:Mg-chelatase subunit ChlD
LRLVGLIGLVGAIGVGGVASAERFDLMKVGRVYLDQVVVSPAGADGVDLYVRAETVIGEPLTGLEPTDLVIRDNGELVDSSKVQLQTLSEARAGVSVVLVLDTSRTMRGEPIERARAAALAFLDRMGDFDHVAIVALNDAVQVVSDFGAPDTATRVALEELAVEPKTLSKVVWDGANKAVELLQRRDPSLPRRSFVILFSDGRDSNSLNSLEEVQALASGGRDGTRTPIFTIGYSKFGVKGFESLDALSAGTGASSFQVADLEELERFYDEIWKRMTRSMIVRYTGDMDGAVHAIEVTVDNRSDTREAQYPDIGTPIWPWLVGLLVLVSAGAGGWFILQSRGSAGHLVFEGGSRSGQSVELRGTRIRIGALEENDVVLNFSTVSRYHAQLHMSGGEVEVEDMGSRNGTWLNGTQVRSRAGIHPGDRLRFGEVEMIYRG